MLPLPPLKLLQFFLLFFLIVGLEISSFAIENQDRKKILWVDSYNSGYAWSDGIERGIRARLQSEDIDFEIFHMDTKKCQDLECMQDSAQRAKVAIDRFGPDVLIASDDNAQKYLIVPHYKETSIPVVFCGVNWDASPYGYPTNTITGMIEVDLVRETVAHMQRFSKGDRIGYISGDTASDRKIISWLNSHFFNRQMKEARVKDFQEFKKRFLELQRDVDMLFIRNFAGIENWDDVAAKKFIAANLTIPSGSNNDFMAPFVVFTLGKISEEQGTYAADTALQILEGTSPGDIPIVSNSQAKLTVNLDMAQAAHIVLPLSVLKMATVVGQAKHDRLGPLGTNLPMDGPALANKRIAWIDSYHRGYEWSDSIERTIRETLFEVGPELKIFRMDSKRKNSEQLMQEAGSRIKHQLDQIKPDVIIASDDNAQKYLIVPYFKETDTPVVFCGVNWSADMYGYPVSNVTGMVEVEPVKETIALLKPYLQGDRVGYLAGDVTTERKLATKYNQHYFNGRMKVYLVKTQAEFEKRFLQAQQEVDILYFSSYAGIMGWNPKTAHSFVVANTRIPTASNSSFMNDFVVCTLAKSSAEQGRYAALTALKILSGQSVSSLPLTTNKESQLTVNLQLAKRAGITFPLAVLKQAQVIGTESLR